MNAFGRIGVPQLIFPLRGNARRLGDSPSTWTIFKLTHYPEFMDAGSGRVTFKGRPSRPEPPAGRPMTGVVLRIVRGQSHGFIRTTDDREVFFHRSDVTGSSFNDLATGDRVTFRVTA